MSWISSVKANILVMTRPATRYLRPPPPSHLKPVSRRWGYERGTAIGRYYVDQFMLAHQDDITGEILEIKNPRYTNSLGHEVTKSDVLDIDASNKHANIITDLATADSVPDNQYDCFILTETLQFVFDLAGAIRHSHRILKPGGVLLVSVPTTGPSDDELFDVDYWRFTGRGCRRLFGEVFGEENVQVEAFGNFVSCTAGLSGLAAEEIPSNELQTLDEKYTLGVGVRAVKAG